MTSSDGTPMQRQSDRWITPGVIIAGIVTGGVVVLGVAAGMVYLASIGRDPDPMMQLVTGVSASLIAAGNLTLQLAARRTQAKVERNTGLLAATAHPGHGAAPALHRAHDTGQSATQPVDPRGPLPDLSVRRLPPGRAQSSARHARHTSPAPGGRVR